MDTQTESLPVPDPTKVKFMDIVYPEGDDDGDDSDYEPMEGDEYDDEEVSDSSSDIAESEEEEEESGDEAAVVMGGIDDDDSDDDDPAPTAN